MNKLFLFVIGALLCQNALALSLGKSHLNSSLSQPLDVEIELYNVGDLMEDEIMVGLASNKVQLSMGVEPNSTHRNLVFKLQEKDGNLVLLVKSRTPVREPFVEMVVQAKWPEGEIRRKYTFTLDPPSSQQ